MCGVGAAIDRTALLQEDLPEGRERMRHQVGSIALRREQDQVGKPLDHHGCHLGEVGFAALKAILHELIDLTVQTVGHLFPFPAAGRILPAHGVPLARLPRAV
jgi:hypothetical protein